jgi:two-component system, chemotaxis family, chemotaxis protein CheY
MRSLKLLVVDDSRAMRSIIRRVLRQAGYEKHEILEAADGRSALDVIKSNRPHLILADWNMPVMNGMDLLKVIRKAKLNIPFGFITAEGTTDMREVATANGADFFVAKPFTAKDFRSALSRFLC